MKGYHRIRAGRFRSVRDLRREGGHHPEPHDALKRLCLSAVIQSVLRSFAQAHAEHCSEPLGSCSFDARWGAEKIHLSEWF
jgi:hypothetical protein